MLDVAVDVACRCRCSCRSSSYACRCRCRCRCRYRCPTVACRCPLAPLDLTRPCVIFSTYACVHSKRLRVCWQHAHIGDETCARVADTHGDVLLSYKRRRVEFTHGGFSSVPNHVTRSTHSKAQHTCKAQLTAKHNTLQSQL